ncbi:MAG: amino acid ABC transporter permease [Anaerolineae bacterium]|nr:amino acid ABC transporter permease [Anaerolineae bacterium]MDQ7035071.1 amino acid ABC transporter permease [Anaerolineae bacterium]
MTNDNKTPNDNDMTYVSSLEPEAKPPPALEAGVLKWIRENLFNSVGNAILTVLGALLVFYTVVNVSGWTIQEGNWLAITANLRQYMVGSFAPQNMWRIQVLTLFSITVMGMAVAVWIKQIARTMIVTMVAIVLALVLLPIVTKSLIELPNFYMLAGQGAVQTGSAIETPIPQVAFIGQADEEITIRFADALVESEATLANLVGYSSIPANTLRNAARNRLALIAERDVLQAELDANAESIRDRGIPTLTDAQIEAHTMAIEGVEIPDAIIETYQVNSISVLVTIVNVATGEVLSEPFLLESADDVATFTLPADGWYILEKVDVNAVMPEVVETTDETEASTPEVNTQDIRNVSTISPTAQSTAAEETVNVGGSVAILEVQGIYPVRLSNVSGDDGFTQVYSRATDFFDEIVVEANPVPRDESNTPLPFVVLTSNQYRGERSFGDFLRAYVTPFFDRIKVNTTIFFVFGLLGYGAVILMENNDNRKRASQLTTYGLISIPALMWIFVTGFQITTAVAIGGVIALGLQCLALYRMGQRNGWRGWRPNSGSTDGDMLVVIAIIVSYLALIMMMERINGGGWAGSIVRLGFIPLILSAAFGSSLNTADSADGISGSAVLMPFWVAGLIIIAIFFSGVGVQDPNNDWLFSQSNPDNWSGLLLTMMLTVYGIIIAFPIGIGLALGRRSDLPLIKYLCTAYIELIRGSPFITVLFFMKLLIPLIRPEFSNVPNGYRAIIATIAFSAAYMAENVRGGLQSLPPGQNEAAKALGLSAWQATLLITLPQALRAVIPALVGQFISLFKDTSLVTIIALVDLTGVVNSMSVQPEFVGTRLEGLVFISILYFVISYVLSYISRLLEASGSGATRRLT